MVLLECSLQSFESERPRHDTTFITMSSCKSTWKFEVCVAASLHQSSPLMCTYPSMIFHCSGWFNSINAHACLPPWSVDEHKSTTAQPATRKRKQQRAGTDLQHARTDLQHARTEMQTHRDEVETSVHPQRIPWCTHRRIQRAPWSTHKGHKEPRNKYTRRTL